jgi:hypothetical protein
MHDPVALHSFPTPHRAHARTRRPAGTLTYYKNGVSQGICFNGVTGPLHPAICFYSSSRAVTVTRCEELAISEAAAATGGAGGGALPCFDLLESRCVLACVCRGPWAMRVGACSPTATVARSDGCLDLARLDGATAPSPFPPCCSAAADITWSNGNRCAESTSSRRAMAVLARGVETGTTAEWTFTLDHDDE